MEKTDVISYRITDVMLELWVRVACFCSGKRRRWKPVHPQTVDVLITVVLASTHYEGMREFKQLRKTGNRLQSVPCFYME